MRLLIVQIGCIMVIALSRTAAAVPSPSEPPTDQQGTQQPPSNPTPSDATSNSSISDASHIATVAPKTQKSAPGTESTATAAKSETTAAKTEKVQLTADERRLIARGYKMVTRNGENYFCHQEEVLGSRLTSKKTCGTVRDLKFVIQQNQDTMQDMQQHHEPDLDPKVR